MKSLMKKALVLLMALTAMLGVVACNTNTTTEVNVVIGSAVTEIKAGDSVTLTATVTGADDKTVTWTSSQKDILAVTEDGVVTVVSAPQEDTAVSIIATANADKTKKAAHQFTVLKGEALSISLNTKTATIKAGETVKLTATVTGADDTGVIWASENEKFLAVSADGVVSVVEAPSVDMTINVTATAKADPSKKVACTFYVKKKISQGEVGELTAAMIEAIGNSAITVSGTITDIYKGLKTSSNSTSTAYSMTVKMEDGKWSGRHNAVENELNVISNTYLRGENIVTDSLGISGYALQESYIDRHNTATVVPVTDYQGYPSVWEEQHLFNHMGQFDVTRFKFDESVGAYEYQIEHINERGDNYYGSDGKVDMTKPAAIDDYLMTYLAHSLTSIFETSEKFDVFYFYVENGKITKIYAETQRTYGYASDGESIAEMAYSTAELNLTEVGTTKVELPAPLEGPLGTNTKGVKMRDLLNSAITEMQTAKSYTYSLKDVSTYVPSGSDDDYTLSSYSTVYPMGTGTTVHNGYSSTGTVGSVAYVTENAVLFKQTFKYDATMDGNAYRTTYNGYKQIDDGSVSGKPYYDEFSYSKDSDGKGTPAMVGTKRVYGTIKEKAMPGFDFSADIFQFAGSELRSGKFIHKFYLVATNVSKDVATQMSAYSYANNAVADGAVLLQIVVDDNGHLVETVFPYTLSRGDVGYCTSTYSNIGTTELPEGVFNDYVAREWKTEWKQYDTKYYYPNHTSLGWTTATSTVNSETVLRAIFGEAYSDLPAPGVFMEVFGDELSGPFFNWETIENGDEKIYHDYIAVNTRSQNYDDNMKITDYDEIMAALDEKLGACGYARSQANCGTSGQDRVVTYIKGDVLIVITNNETRHFSMYFRKAGEWSLKK